MQVVLHIGTPKTATTFVQGVWVLNRRRLAEEAGVLYPEAGRLGVRRLVGSQHSLFFAALDDDHQLGLRIEHDVVEAQAMADYRARFEVALDAEIAAARPRTLLMSSEHLYQNLERPSELRRLRDWVARRSDRPPILLVCLREPTDLITSVYAEYVRSGHLKGFRSWLTDFLDDPQLPDRRRMDVAEWLAPWAEVFGDDALRLVRYRQPGRSGDLCDALGAAAGLPDISGWPRPPRLRASPPAGTLQLMRLRNRLAPRFRDGRFNPAWNWKISRRVDRLSLGRPLRLPPEAAARLRALFAEGEREAARRWLGEDTLFP